MERAIVGLLMLVVIGGLLALLTQVDGCDFGDAFSSSSNTYDRARR